MDKTLSEKIENPANYITHIKKNCKNCGKPIPKTWKHYKEKGNWCVDCLRRVNEIIIENKKHYD